MTTNGMFAKPIVMCHIKDIHMRLISNQDNQQRIQDSFDRICNNCPDDLRQIIQEMSLIVADDSTAQSIYSDQYNLFQRAYSEGFGGIKGNINFENEWYHLVVLNISKINEFNLTDCEFDGVLSHELGHIFNENPRREIPSILRGNTLTEIDEAKKLSLKESETYADYFSKRTNCSQGLISSINKYLLSDNCLNRELFETRLEQLRSEDILLGTIKVRQ